MENKLTKDNIRFALNTLRELRKGKSEQYYVIGMHVGFLEGALQSFGKLETEKDSNGRRTVKREIIKSTKWYKKDRLEDIEEAIVRMVNKFLSEETNEK